MVSGTATWLCFLMLAMALGAPPEGAVDPSSGGTDAPPKPALPSSYWGWKGASGQKPSYSVVIPAHNTAGRILDTLRSVQASIEYFHKNGGKEVTMARVMWMALLTSLASPSFKERWSWWTMPPQTTRRRR